MAKRSPPAPFIVGSTTASTAAAVTAASMALPPDCSTLQARRRRQRLAGRDGAVARHDDGAGAARCCLPVDRLLAAASRCPRLPRLEFAWVDVIEEWKRRSGQRRILLAPATPDRHTLDPKCLFATGSRGSWPSCRRRRSTRRRARPCSSISSGARSSAATRRCASSDRSWPGAARTCSTCTGCSTSRCTPLHPDIPLIFGSGVLTGIVPSAARGNATSWSPESGVLLDSNAGDYFPSFIRMNGIDHIVLYGRAAAWTLLHVKNGEIAFLDATPYVGPRQHRHARADPERLRRHVGARSGDGQHHAGRREPRPDERDHGRAEGLLRARRSRARRWDP